ncbi:MAG: hypothetical protein NC213_02555 [Acetobacter sp.]|nr:hypothetical protein [Bacteroides sp.]MCM1340601.1 hypothetical protein [Acetobacter sp.]MCM1433341.1 hypothetical protein [Clostridiales bacterium]
MNCINYFLDIFSLKLKSLILMNPTYIIERITEFRIRKNKPLIIYIDSKAYFLNNNGELSSNPSEYSYLVEQEEFEIIIEKLCNNSIHTNMSNMINGYVTAKNGSRVGICSSAVYKQGCLTSVKDISSINIRIAKECINCSRNILNEIYKEVLPSIIVASPPSMGKTTFLRDFTRLISSGYNGRYQKAIIIDERCELSAGFDVGYNCDVIKNYSKEKGIEIALRTMSPDIIICDEIATNDELKKIQFGFSTGVKFAVSVHLKDIENISAESITGKLIDTGEFDYLIILQNYTNAYKIYDLRDVGIETDRNINDDFLYNIFGNYNSQL